MATPINQLSDAERELVNSAWNAFQAAPDPLRPHGLAVGIDKNTGEVFRARSKTQWADYPDIVVMQRGRADRPRRKLSFQPLPPPEEHPEPGPRFLGPGR
jgi:hypothetical protein